MPLHGPWVQYIHLSDMSTPINMEQVLDTLNGINDDLKDDKLVESMQGVIAFLKNLKGDIVNLTRCIGLTELENDYDVYGKAKCMQKKMGIEDEDEEDEG